MAASPLPSLPYGSDVFLDANIFVYALLKQSQQCWDLLERCAREEVFGVTTLDAVTEATHKLMLMEACAKGYITKETAKALKGNLKAVVSLCDYWHQTEAILNQNLLLLETDEAKLRRAYIVRSTYGLLTRDSIFVATMQEYDLRVLVSRDGDFDRIPFLIRYEPTDCP